MKEILIQMIQDFYPFAKKELGFNKPVRVFLRNDLQNSINPLGKTAFYSPDEGKITLCHMNRHPKDVLRSFAHELVHHKQYCEDRLHHTSNDVMEDGDLQQLEEEANAGGFLVRKWETCLEKNKEKDRYINAYLRWKDAKPEGEVTYLEEKKKRKRKKAKLKKKINPWAVCTASTGRENKDKYEDCVLSVKKKHGIKKESLQESKVTKNADFERDLDDTTESDTVKDHFSRRAERMFEKLTEKWKTKKESEVSKDG